MTYLLALLLAYQTEPAPMAADSLSDDDRRQIIEVFRSTWENNYRILRPHLTEANAGKRLPELVDVIPNSCSGLTQGLRGFPGCDLTIRIRYESGTTETAPASWRFLRTENGEWWDVGTYLRSRY